MTKDTSFDVELPQSNSIVIRFINGLFRILEAPGDFARKKLVEPNQQKYPYYHQKFRRVPTVDMCYEDDPICIHEADMQFLRDKKVESKILFILRQRFEDCVLYEGPDAKEKCQPLHDIMKEAETNWFIKYGDLGVIGKSKECYLKQKHRMIWERRHGTVGSGVKK
ncbi:NADH dehydrogenase (ubiquinone) PDSW subunit [Lycorma delicatula]|uniref:NADH dehydrogenase (ubiquinone) PDSW subunit n=1 Tax=Lycorma delicatula TaxID=130591 RepID=UPI003F5142EE